MDRNELVGVLALLTNRVDMTRAPGHHDAIEDKLLGLAGTARYKTLSSRARGLTKELLSEGHDRTRLLDAYEVAITRLYEEDLDEPAEELLEVMAEVEGRCSPHARL